MLLNGKVTSIHHVLADPRLAVVLSDEGVVASLRRYIPAKPQHLARLQEAMLAASISSEP